MLFRVVKFILLAYLAAFCQSVLSNIMAIHQISPNFGTIIIVLVLLKREADIALPAAFLVGLVVDALDPAMFGLGTALRFALALMVVTLKNEIDVEPLRVRICLIAGTELVFQLVYQSIANRFDGSILPMIFLETSLPTLVYTTVLGVTASILADLQLKLEVRSEDGYADQ